MVKAIVFLSSFEIEKRFGRGMCENKPIVKNLTNFSRNTSPLYDIIL